VKAKLFVDEDASEASVVSALRRHGVDVLTVVDARRQSLSDEDQLRFAASLHRSLYSLNVRDFARIHREFVARGVEHAGIILIPRQRYSMGEKIRRLQNLLDSASPTGLQNTIHFL
jgi:hypothetical protein